MIERPQIGLQSFKYFNRTNTPFIQFFQSQTNTNPHKVFSGFSGLTFGISVKICIPLQRIKKKSTMIDADVKIMDTVCGINKAYKADANPLPWLRDTFQDSVQYRIDEGHQLRDEWLAGREAANLVVAVRWRNGEPFSRLIDWRNGYVWTGSEMYHIEDE